MSLVSQMYKQDNPRKLKSNKKNVFIKNIDYLKNNNLSYTFKSKNTSIFNVLLSLLLT